MHASNKIGEPIYLGDSKSLASIHSSTPRLADTSHVRLILSTNAKKQRVVNLPDFSAIFPLDMDTKVQNPTSDDTTST